MGFSGRVGIGIVGFGIGKIYAAAFSSVPYYYHDLPPVELVGIATASPGSAARAAEHFGFRQQTTDYRDLLSNDDIQAIVVAPPNYLHYPVLMDCLDTDKALYVDKPLANSLDEARAILQRAKARGRDGQMIFEVRYCPALLRAHELIHSGQVGKIHAFRAHYYRSSYADPNRSLRWKASQEKSGTGALGDLGSHLIDLIAWLASPPVKLTAQMSTVTKERPGESGKPAKVETDDHVILQAQLASGAQGTIEAARVFRGAVNDFQVEIYGSRASLRWNMMNPNYLYRGDDQGWLEIPTVQTYPDAFLPGADVPAGLMRYHIASAAAFLRATFAGQVYDPGLAQGAQVQAVIQAALEASQAQAWVSVPEVEI